MRVLNSCPAYVDKEGEMVFDHTKFILTDKDDFFVATTHALLSSNQEVDISKLVNVKAIPASHLWPTYTTAFARGSTPCTPTLYLKEPNLILYEADPFTDIAALIIEEAKVLETLENHPHPNVARYHGCHVVGDQIRGLWLEKYPMTLPERLLDTTRPLHLNHFLDGIRDGICHIHSLGLVHNDINPANIMVTNEDIPIIIDFDSCRKKGAALGLKAGTFPWIDKDLGDVVEENDWYGFVRIKRVLEGHVLGEVLQAPDDA